MTHETPNPGPVTGSGEPHRRAWDLLCWVAAGTATEADRLLVEAHLADCLDCREEWAFQQQLRQALRQGAAKPGDAEVPLHRLMARIDAVDARAEWPRPVPTAAAATVTPPWARRLAAAVMVQAAVLAVALALVVAHGGAVPWQRDTGSERADFRTFSNNPQKPTAAVVRLVPAASMDFAALQALLARHRLTIVQASADGSSLGLATAGSAPPPTSVLLQHLRAEPGVLMAEPIVRHHE